MMELTTQRQINQVKEIRSVVRDKVHHYEGQRWRDVNCGNIRWCSFFYYYLIDGMEGVCFYGEVFKTNAFCCISRLRRLRRFIRLIIFNYYFAIDIGGGGEKGYLGANIEATK